MSSAPLQAHSIVEVQLYLKVAACDCCGKGPLRCDDPIGKPTLSVGDLGSPDPPAALDLSCMACGATWLQPIELVRPPTSDGSKDSSIEKVGLPTINPTSEPSHIIDLGQWLVLVSLLTDEAGRETDRGRARELGISAARCLDEALKFYTDAENDLPPPEAFFHETSRERFHDSPEKFSRQRIAGMKSKLPSPYTGR